MRAADSATKRRETADLDRPVPAGAGTSPSAKRTDRANSRVATLIRSGSWTICRANPAQQRLQLGTASPFPSSRAALAARSQPCRRGPISPLVLPTDAPAADGLAHGGAHRSIVRRDPSSRRAPPCRKPGKTTQSSPQYSKGLRALALSSGWQSCSSLVHGVALLCGIQHPEPIGSRRATPLLLFQHQAGQFRTLFASVIRT